MTNWWFFGLIIAFNPLGTTKGQAYTFPKVIILFVITIQNFYKINWNRQKFKEFIKQYLIWSIFLFFINLSSKLSPNPLISIWGQPEMGDGLLYWHLVCLFSCTTSLLDPEELKRQKQGLILGGVLTVVLMIFQQLFDFRITIFEILGDSQKPNGFFSNRGHVAIIMLMLYSLTNCPLFLLGTVLNQTRAAYLLLIPLLPRKVRTWSIIFLVCLIIITPRQFSNPNPSQLSESLINKISTNRIESWRIGYHKILNSPIIGYGSDGFGQSIPLPFRWTWKAHNLIIDLILSYGILGFLSWTLLMSSYLPTKYPKTVLIYLIYSLFWYDCAQYTHLLFWCLVQQKLKN